MPASADPVSAQPNSGKIRVALVFGGRSSEHPVSCASAGSVMRALDPERYEVIPVGITPQGQWVLAGNDPEQMALSDGEHLPQVQARSDAAGAVVLAPDPTRGSLTVSSPGRIPQELGTVDVVFPLLHGAYGEDGTIQGLLEMAGVPYVGAGIFASAAGMDKGHMKAVFRAAGLPVGPYEMITGRQWRTQRDHCLARVQASQTLPVFVKPARAGSSVGITKVKAWQDLAGAIDEASRHDPRVIVETGIVGREIECGVLDRLDGGPADVSVCVEVNVGEGHEWFDFESKYLGDGSYDIPARMPEALSDQVREVARRAFEALDCEGLARVDFFVTDSGEILLNEVNTMPGLTSASGFPKMWQASGLGYATLVERLIALALARPNALLR